MGYEQLDKEIRFVNFKGKDRIQRLTEFLKYIQYFDTKAIVIANGHKNIKDHIETLKLGKMNFCAIIRDEGKEFEDLFDSKTIIDAMKNLSLKNVSGLK
jgi:hypothetical protein